MAFTLNDLGNNIKNIRLTKKSQQKPGKSLLQKELAELAGIPASSLCNIENGRYKNPTWDMLTKIASGLNCDIADFFVKEKKEIPASQIALTEMIEMIIRERLKDILKESK
ncbi:MAG: helix-turn-helix transcriptional regulator [Candidatus Aminicenantes bacterium]|nr:helix-turn-helix transcriptional regulator [Candidatus Aminicenantes bacterium]